MADPRPLRRVAPTVSIETFGLDPRRVASRAIALAPTLTPVELANTVRGCVIAARAAHDENDDIEHAAALVRLQVVAAEMAWRLDPRGDREPEYQHKIASELIAGPNRKGERCGTGRRRG